MELKSMTDYVLNQFKICCYEKKPDFETFEDYVIKTRNYANFLKQTLKLGMFIPCDENDVPLDEPKFKDTRNSNLHFLATEKYQQAKECVVFEGFELVERYTYGALLEMKFDDFEERINIVFEETIEDLLTCYFDPGFEITDNAVKKYKL